MAEFSPETAKRLLYLKRAIFECFSATNWRELGLVTQCSNIIEGHSRLLRSLSYNDNDYESCVIDVLEQMARYNRNSLDEAEKYVAGLAEGKMGVTDAPAMLNRCLCAPEVFKVPNGEIDKKLIALMMPFDARFDAVCIAIKEAASGVGLHCKRVDDIWNDSTIIQDVFALIYHASIVVCDFSGRNPNVLYEAGIAHTLGRKVIPLVQHISDIPFDLQHHRHLVYLPNQQGLDELKVKLAGKLRQEIGRGQ